MSKREFTPIRRAATSTPTNPPPGSDEPWQQLMLVNYLMFEAIDAMAQERAGQSTTPLNDHWHGFVHHLRQRKPNVNTCLYNLTRDGFLQNGESQQ